ncbi:MAG: hypothetical protein KAX49_07285 [Halanaerobiales bacterium]|nr:hypothetical protein [Halanaerobiales bacterium]
MNKKINILGQDYVIKYGDRSNDPKLEDVNAYVEIWSKEIVIDKDLLSKRSTKEVNNLELYRDKVLRHEIIHALFHESGLRDYFDDEELVDWIALTYPKMKEIFNKLEI